MSETAVEDYTIMVSGFPKVSNIKRAIKAWAEPFGQVADINLAYVLDTFNKLKK